MLSSNVVENSFSLFPSSILEGKNKDRRHHDTQKVFTMIEEFFPD